MAVMEPNPPPHLSLQEQLDEVRKRHDEFVKETRLEISNLRQKAQEQEAHLQALDTFTGLNNPIKAVPRNY